MSDGSTYRDVRVVETRPDALIVAHRNGVLMADFEKLPKAVRERYGLNAKKAQVHREKEAAKRRFEAEEDRRLVAAYEARKLSQIHMRLAGEGAEASSFAGINESELTYRPDGAERSLEKAVKYVGEEIAQIEAARAEEAREADSFWNSSFWKNPVMTFIGSLLGASTGGNERGGGFNSEPRGWR